MKTVIFMRNKRAEACSIEEIFYPLCPYLGNNVEIIELPYSSSSIFNIIRNIIFAYKHRGDVNHISGEVHYIGIGLGHKTVLTVHDVNSILKFQHDGKIKKLIKKLLWFTFPFKSVGTITCISKSTYQEIIERFPFAKKKLRIVHNPISARMLSNKKVLTLQESKANEILHVGTPPHKNLETVIPICADLNCRLLILGKMSETQHELAKCCNLNYEEFYNISYSEVIKLYERVKFVSFPSKYEGFGMPILEANIMEVPIVAGDIPVLHEVANDAALFVNPNDANEIKDSFKKLLVDKILREDLIAKGRNNIKRFSPESIGKEYQQIYESITCK